MSSSSNTVNVFDLNAKDESFSPNISLPDEDGRHHERQDGADDGPVDGTETNIKLDSLLPLLQHPPDIKLDQDESGVYHICGRIAEADREALISYARLVSELRLSDITKSISPNVYVKLAALSSPLFPRLSHLSINASDRDSLQYLDVFLASSLRSLEICEVAESSKSAFLMFLATLRDITPTLDEIAFRMCHFSKKSIEYLSSFQHLTTLKLVDSFPIAIDYLLIKNIGRISTLECLHLHDNGGKFYVPRNRDTDFKIPGIKELPRYSLSPEELDEKVRIVASKIRLKNEAARRGITTSLAKSQLEDEIEAGKRGISLVEYDPIKIENEAESHGYTVAELLTSPDWSQNQSDSSLAAFRKRYTSALEACASQKAEVSRIIESGKAMAAVLAEIEAIELMETPQAQSSIETKIDSASFPSLKVLKLTGRPELLNDVLEYTASTTLSVLSLSLVSTSTPLKNSCQFIAATAVNKWAPTLTHFEIHVLDTIPHHVISDTELQRIFFAPNVKHLQFGSTCVSDRPESLIHLLENERSPLNLELLHLPIPPPGSPVGHCPLEPLIDACPNLKSLGISMDCEFISELLRPLNVGRIRSHALQSLCIYDRKSLVDSDARKLSHYLDRLFPNILDFSMGVCGAGDKKLMRKSGEEVQQLLQMRQEARLEERLRVQMDVELRNAAS